MEDISFFAVDTFICVVILLSFIIGWARGATKEILSVVAWIGGGYLAVCGFFYCMRAFHIISDTLKCF